MKTPSSWRASNANAVSSRSRPTTPGSSVRSEGETGGTVRPPASASTPAAPVPAAGERRHDQRDVGHARRAPRCRRARASARRGRSAARTPAARHARPPAPTPPSRCRSRRSRSPPPAAAGSARARTSRRAAARRRPTAAGRDAGDAEHLEIAAQAHAPGAYGPPSRWLIPRPPHPSARVPRAGRTRRRVRGRHLPPPACTALHPRDTPTSGHGGRGINHLAWKLPCAKPTPSTTSSCASTATATSPSSSPSPTAARSSTRCARSPGRRFDWEAKEWWALQADQTAPYVKGVIERHPWLKVAPEVERWLAQAADGWVGRVGAGKRLGAGRFVLETIAGELDDDLAPLAESAGGRLWLPFTGRGRDRARRAAGRALRRARAALRAPPAGRARAGAGDAVADRQRRGAALQARRQLGPRDDPRLPRAARLRGARALAAGRPLPARAARALPAHVRRRGRAERRRRARAPAGRARRRDRGRPPLARPRRAGAGDRVGARRRAAAVPARRHRLRAEGAAHASSPTSRASARPCRRSARSRPTTPTRPSSSAPPR